MDESPFKVASMPLPLPIPIAIPHAHNQDVPGFPLPTNATARELLTLVDALALKIYPKGYWQLSWALNAVNLATFFTVTIALRAYRSRHNTVPFWLFKLERRAYTVHHVNRFKRFVKASVKNLLSKRRSSVSSHVERVDSKTLEEDEDAPRMGWFFTASCVNCHLILTSAYVILLSIEVLQSYLVRDPTAPPPLLDPGMLNTLMLLSIFSTAYFAALGYVALLLPFAPPWFWNTGVVGLYSFTILLGLVSLSKVASSQSRLNTYRAYLHLAVYPLAQDAVDDDVLAAVDPATVKMVLVGIAKEAYRESLNHRSWQVLAGELVAVGGFTITLSYLAILVLLVRKVAKELVQLRSVPTGRLADPAAAFPSISSTVSVAHARVSRPAVPAPASQVLGVAFGTSLPQPHRFSLPVRSHVRSPPSTPAPVGPLPLPPVEDAEGSSRSSTPEAIAYVDSSEKHTCISAASSPRHSLRLLNTDVMPIDQQKPANPAQRSSASCAAFAKQGSASNTEHHHRRLASSIESGRHHRPVSPSQYVGDDSSLDLGPRIRRDSEPTPWDLTTMHEQMVTDDGYAAVCRFLFNCIIDHTAVMLQSCAFACHSAYMALIFKNDYASQAEQTSSVVGIARMAASTLFTVLYVLNCLNLFAPFLLFPASQVKLASMLASLALSDSRRDRARHTARSEGKGSHAGRTSATSGSISQVQRLVRGKDEVSRLQHQDSSATLVASAADQMAGKDNASASQSMHSVGCAPRSDAGKSFGVIAVSRSELDKPSAIPSNDVRQHVGMSVGTAPASASPREQKVQWDASCELTAQRGTEATNGTFMGKAGAKLSSAIQRFRPSSPQGLCTQTPTWSEHGLGRQDPASSTAAFSPDTVTPDRTSASRTLTPLAWRSSLFPSQRAIDRAQNSTSGTLTSRPRSPSRAGSPHYHQSGSQSHDAQSLLSASECGQHRPRGAQLVLDSLISSHALPIGGFYCHGSSVAAVGSTSGLGLYRGGGGGDCDSAERGMRCAGSEAMHVPDRCQGEFGRRFGHGQERAQAASCTRDLDRKQPQQPQQPQQQNRQQEQRQQSRDDDDESQERLRPAEEEGQRVAAHGDALTALGGGGGEASKRRRERMRRQFRAQFEHRRSLGSPSADTCRLSSISSSSNGSRSGSSPVLTPLGLDQQACRRPSSRQLSSPRLGWIDWQLGDSHADDARVVRRDSVPTIVAQPPSPLEPPQPPPLSTRAGRESGWAAAAAGAAQQAQLQLQVPPPPCRPDAFLDDDGCHPTMISIPTLEHAPRSARAVLCSTLTTTDDDDDDDDDGDDGDDGEAAEEADETTEQMSRRSRRAASQPEQDDAASIVSDTFG